jgi:RimJ/RimL family protein N-acetyltransferase
MVQDQFKLETYYITPNRLIQNGEEKSLKLIVVRLVFMLITLGKAKMYCLRENDELIHTSYVIPKCCKFPFLGEDDYEIGPCMTYTPFRGKGYYSMMLRYICENVGTQQTNFYMIVDESNLASIRGIEKAGFERCGNIRVTKIMKRYLIEK